MSSAERLSRATETRRCEFERVLLIHTGEDPETDLLDYVAKLGARETIIAAYPFDGVLRSMAAAARMRFEAHGSAAPVLRALPEFDIGWVLDAARDADLLIIRQAGAFGGRHTIVRRILDKSPCSVFLAPAHPPSPIERVLAGIKLDETGHAVLERAGSVGRAVGAGELIAVHCCSHDIYLDLDEDGQAEFRFERTLELYRFMARSKPLGIPCTPEIEDSLEPRRGLALAARKRSADLVVVGKRQGMPPQLADGMVRDGTAPVMQVLLPPPPNDGIRGKLRRVFSNPGLKFN